MEYLTTNEVLDLIGAFGITPKQFRLWCEKGIIAPEEGGNGQGNHRRFTRMQAVGLAVAARLYGSEQGCVPAYVGKVVAAFGAGTEGWLLKEFAAGRTHFATEHYGKPVLAGKAYDWPDVRAAYRAVAEQQHRAAGRTREAVAAKA